MVSSSWKVSIGLILILLSAVLGVIHYAVFRDAKTLLFYLVLDVVFVPVQVLLVTLIIEHLLEERERLTIFNKLNMVIGALYSEVGSELLSRFRSMCIDSSLIGNNLKVGKEWKDEDFSAAVNFVKNYRYNAEFNISEVLKLRELLLSKRFFILSLLQNPNLLEHDRFTDLLWSVLHLTEELAARSDVTNLPPEDIDHIINDMRRAFGLVVTEWLEYMKHLKADYPYLFSLASRTNPFNPDASVIITE